jgi:NTP pyrophosphatase (non-canonical NTP hydrolase)
MWVHRPYHLSCRYVFSHRGIRNLSCDSRITGIGAKMNSLQEEVYQAVKDRGYLDTEKWSRDQLIVRQVIKLIEEVGETGASVTFENEELGNPGELLCDAVNVGASAKRIFNVSKLNKSYIWTYSLISELADIQVVVFVLAELLGVDIVELARGKACTDVSRGVTC